MVKVVPVLIGYVFTGGVWGCYDQPGDRISVREVLRSNNSEIQNNKNPSHFFGKSTKSTILYTSDNNRSFTGKTLPPLSFPLLRFWWNKKATYLGESLEFLEGLFGVQFYRQDAF